MGYSIRARRNIRRFVDGENNIIADMYGGDAYEGRFANSVVINGVLYYNTAGNGLYAQTSIPGIQAIDLHTGEKLWFLNGTFLNFGQTMFFPSYNVNGVWNYLWSVTGSNYTAYSPNDGSFQFMFHNVPSGYRILGSKRRNTHLHKSNYTWLDEYFGTQR